MKKIFLPIIFLVGFILWPSFANAEGINKEVWYETNYYPVLMDSEESKNLGLNEMLDILNPPEDLLQSFKTEELAELLMDYPFLWVLSSYEYEDRYYFWWFIENSSIYNELMNRSDGKESILKQYQISDFDIDKCNKNENIILTTDPMIGKEVFGCQFIIHFWDSFSDTELALCNDIITEKEKCYSQINSELTKKYLSFDHNNNANNQETYFNEDNDYSRGIMSGFSATGSPYYRSIENVSIKFTPGIYNKYNVNAICDNWYNESGNDYSSTKRQALDNSIAFNWEMISSSSPKYNCHSYAWLISSSTNKYWLDSPTPYMNSSSVTYVGSNTTPQTWDIIVMYNTSGNIAHSAIVTTTPSGNTGIYTTSKIGGRALYRAPLSELMTYYSCNSYSVYRY